MTDPASEPAAPPAPKLPSRRPAPRPRSAWPLVLLGLGLLAVSGLVAWLLLRPGDTSVPSAHQPQPSAGFVVCFGFVDVESGVLQLPSLQAGQVVEVPVREGESVKAGAALLKLDDAPYRAKEEEAKAAWEVSRSRLAEARKLPQRHNLRLKQQEAAVAAAEAKAKGARSVRDRKQQMLATKLADPADVAVAEALAGEAEALERAEQAKLDELALENPAATIAQAGNDVEMAQARLDQARQARSACVLTAPRAGTVLRILAGRGAVLGGPAAGQAAVWLRPDEPLVVRAEVDQEFAARIAAGMPAEVEDDTRSPATRWKARVLRTSGWLTQRRTVLREPQQAGDVRAIECLIAFDGPDPPLRIGQRVRVTVGETPQ